MSLPGSFQARKKDGTVYYRASITHLGKHISLGSFSTEEDASSAYCEAGKILDDNSILLEDHNALSLLSFEKWVVLINYRDNKLYFPTPIYLKKKFFHYYLSKTCRLTFDMEDLFFYASHKITRRKGHLFVADYGMQLTITNRYGIKNYGICGKDYRFINGDDHDFRYENIEILNPYHGVSTVNRNNKICYCAKIHLNGNYIIGYYRDGLEAAIAYNKAIDIVKRNGNTKNFTYNDMEGISPSLYAEIYRKVHISPKIYNYAVTGNNHI